MGHHQQEHEENRAGMPGDIGERREETGNTGVHPLSGPEAEGDMPARTPAEWGQGVAGPAGYEDSGESEIRPSEPARESGSSG